MLWFRRRMPAALLRLSLLAVAAAALVGLTGCFGRPALGTAIQLQGVVTTLPSSAKESARPLEGVVIAYGATTTQTGPDGRFRLAGLPVGAIQLTASKGTGFPAQQFSATVVSGSTTTVEIRLKNLHQLYAPAAASAAASHTRHVTGEAGCATCHSVDNPVGSMMLRDGTNDLCLGAGCHAAPAFAHPAAHLDPAGHPELQPGGRYAEYSGFSCLTCHRPHPDSATWVEDGLLASADLRLTSTPVCGGCHNQLPSTHPVVGANPCSMCHDPNGVPHGHASCSGYSGKFGTPCHASSRTIAMSPHTDRTKPQLAGGCASCHDTAGTANPKLLRWPNDNNLCYQCHLNGISRDSGPLPLQSAILNWPGKAGYESTKNYWYDRKSTNGSLRGDGYVNYYTTTGTGMPSAHYLSAKNPNFSYPAGACLNCHEPHGQKDAGGHLIPQLLRAAEPELCYICHASKRAEMANTALFGGSDSKHSVDSPTSTLKCSTCHNPHVVQKTAGRRITVPWQQYWPSWLDDEPDHESDAGGYYHYLASARFCTTCHDGSWPPALRVFQHTNTSGIPTVSPNYNTSSWDAPTGFKGPIPPGGKYTNYHLYHIGPIGCIRCHDPHATPGSAGTNRGRMLRPDVINVVGYRNGQYADGKASCQTSCHSTSPACASCHTWYDPPAVMAFPDGVEGILDTPENPFPVPPPVPLLAYVPAVE